MNKIVTIGGILVLLLIAGCLSPNVPPGDNPPVIPPGGNGGTTTPPPTYAIDLTFEQLQSGDFTGIIQCGGPLYAYGHFDDYIAAFPTIRPAMFVTYYSIKDSRASPAQKLNQTDLELKKYSDMIPFIGISYTSSTKTKGVGQGWDVEVANGDYDTELIALAKRIAQDERPIFVRPGFEFNGIWNNYSPQSYIDSFKHIHDLFIENGATNTIWVWNYMPQGNVAPYSEFYPGNEYVDYWGVNLFGSAFDSTTNNGKQYIARTNAFLEDAQAHGKPVLIPESVPDTTHEIQTEPGATKTWNDWFMPYFELINNPKNNVKGFCYSNGNYTEVPGFAKWGNMSINTSVLKEKWADELGKDQYINAP
jgi:hypothetical protein